MLPPLQSSNTKRASDIRRDNQQQQQQQQKRNQTKKKNRMSVNELVEEYKRQQQDSSSNSNSSRKGSNHKKYKRSRKRVDKPKQTYVYAAKRREMERMGIMVDGGGQESQGGERSDNDNNNNEHDSKNSNSNTRIRLQLGEDSPITIARKMGLNPEMQGCYPSYTWNTQTKEMEPVTEPRIVGQVRVGTASSDSDTSSISSMYAYIIEKPSGWMILESNKKKNKKNKRTEGKDLEKNHEDINEDSTSSSSTMTTTTNNNNNNNNNNINDQQSNNDNANVKKLKYFDQDSKKVSTWDLDMDEFDLSSVMTTEELEEFHMEGGIDTFNYGGASNNALTSTQQQQKSSSISSSSTAATMSGGKRPNTTTKSSSSSSSKNNNSPAMFKPESRPAVVSWLKELKAAEGTPIRGGKNWKAIAGAIDIDDSGLVILCPKENVDNIFVDRSEYVLVVGNGKYLAPKGKKSRQQSSGGGGSSSSVSSTSSHNLEEVEFETYAKVKKGRGEDIVTTVTLNIPDGASTCNDAVQLSQNKFMDGIRGDARASPLELRANRRLVHCASLTVSSLAHDDLVECESDVPDDIRILSERRNNHQYKNGSFLGRNDLCVDEGTNAYREINGAADGWPGWIVDRYDKWLLVQHDDMYIKGPLPSLHDGNTAGVYYFSSDPDRSITGAVKGIKPTVLEGQPAPEVIEIKENGIIYHVNFDDLSTGIFLDQRSQRAWLSRHCSDETRVLNCFAHCGAFSVAAAMGGAETVSLDLDKKWLDRIHPQLEANGILDNDRHDCIYGDCKYVCYFNDFYLSYYFLK